MSQKRQTKESHSVHRSVPQGRQEQQRLPHGFFLPDTERKLGITTPRKSGNAVRRNRIKRIMREKYRLNPALFPDKGTLVFRLKRTDDEAAIIEEMVRLTENVVQRATKTKEII